LDEQQVRPDRGFGLGGRSQALLESLHLPTSIAAAANPKVAATSSFYYVFPHGQPDWTKIEGPVLMHFGTADAFIPVSDAEGIVEAAKAGGVDVVAEFYEGAGHAFCNAANRLGTYDEAQAELAFSRNLEFFEKNLS